MSAIHKIFGIFVGGALLGAVGLSPNAVLDQNQVPGQGRLPEIFLTDRQTYELPNTEFRVERVRRPDYRFAGTIVDDEEVKRIVLKLAHYSSPEDWAKWVPAGMAPLSDAETVLDPELGRNKIENYSMSFTIDLKLKPGLSVFVIQATDQGTKLITRQDYHVLYAPMFYRSGWFVFPLTGLAASAFVSLVVLRARRRAAHFKRRFNPFIAGSPVQDDKLFFGRERLIENILQSVHNNSIMLFGERRIGKTSLQHQLKKRLMQLKDPQFAFFPVFIDLQGTPEDRFFMTLRDEIRHELAPQFGADFLVSAVPDGYPCDYRDLIRELNSIIKLLAARTNKRVKLVLLIDEIDQLNDYDPRINQRLRSLFMRDFSENLAAVVSGVSIKKQWAGEGSPWYNFFEEIEVKPLSREDAEKLIKRPVRGRFKLKKGVVERILSSTGCKPYLIQKTCIALVNKMYNEGRRTIGPADVDGIGWPSEE